MAAFDLMPFRDPHGGNADIRYFPMNAGETFLAGEPVAVNADGELTESADDPLDADLMGIALAPGGVGFQNIKTGVAYAVGDLIPVAIPNPNALYITRNWSVAGVAFNDAAPTAANIGDAAGLTLLGGVWGVDISALNTLVRVTDILDSLKRSILETRAVLSTADTYYVVFNIVAHQSLTLIEADAPLI